MEGTIKGSEPKHTILIRKTIQLQREIVKLEEFVNHLTENAPFGNKEQHKPENTSMSLLDFLDKQKEQLEILIDRLSLIRDKLSKLL